MRLSVATNFDDQLIDQIKKYPIYEVYGKLPEDIIGGGRATNYLNSLDIQRFENHVAKVREAGIHFNYLLNSACLSNLNQDGLWVVQVIAFLKYLKTIGVDALTITNPYLVELVKRYFSKDFVIRVSSFACIDTYEKAKFWDELGVDIICVDFCKVNRNFKVLQYMVKHLKCKLEMLCTNSCLKDCPMIHTHVNDIAHASNSRDEHHLYEDWGLNFCQQYQLEYLHEYIKSPWIRPEDLHYYEEIGIEHFKITERDFPTEWLVRRVEAYCNRCYRGNLLDLIQGSGVTCNDQVKLSRKSIFHSRYEILKEIQKVRGIGCRREVSRHIMIHTRLIPTNFLEFFVQGKCSGRCDECCYCKKISDKVISVNHEVRDYLLFLYQKFNEVKFESK